MYKEIIVVREHGTNMKNKKMSTKITLQISVVIVICITLLYVVASQSMAGMMKKSELENMDALLNAQTNIIKQYIDAQETMLIAYSRS